MTDIEKIGQAINRAADELPEGWELVLTMCNGTGEVTLCSEVGPEFYVPTQETIWDAIDAAVDYALEHSA